MKNIKFINVLRTIGFIEGCSTLILFFVAMPLKYAFDTPIAVTYAGATHGALFILLLTCAFIAFERSIIPIKLTLIVVIAAIIPFGPFVIDKKLKALS